MVLRIEEDLRPGVVLVPQEEEKGHLGAEAVVHLGAGASVHHFGAGVR